MRLLLCRHRRHLPSSLPLLHRLCHKSSSRFLSGSLFRPLSQVRAIYPLRIILTVSSSIGCGLALGQNRRQDRCDAQAHKVWRCARCHPSELWKPACCSVGRRRPAVHMGRRAFGPTWARPGGVQRVASGCFGAFRQAQARKGVLLFDVHRRHHVRWKHLRFRRRVIWKGLCPRRERAAPSLCIQAQARSGAELRSTCDRGACHAATHSGRAAQWMGSRQRGSALHGMQRVVHNAAAAPPLPTLRRCVLWCLLAVALAFAVKGLQRACESVLPMLLSACCGFCTALSRQHCNTTDERHDF